MDNKFELHSKFYNYQNNIEREEFFNKIIKNYQICKRNKKYYYNTSCSFDIETTSFYGETEDGEQIKSATMYIWQFGINGWCIYGRTWQEYIEFTSQLAEKLELSYKLRLIVYVHNLGYEFQFMRKWFSWTNIFALKQRRPVYAECENGIEYRCSLFLSNYALAYIGDNLLKKYPVQKMVGDLDYSLHRNSKTPLTDAELKYCMNDILVVMAYIQEKIEQDGSITNIPLTNTGYVRNYCRKECFFDGCMNEELKRKKSLEYHSLMTSLQITSEEEYEQMQRAFMGGFTHANAINSNKILENVGSADLGSSYPYHMISEYYPMTRGLLVGEVNTIEDLEKYLTRYCCLFDITFKNIRPSQLVETPISVSRCVLSNDYIQNNGRLVKASECTTTLTELDFDTIQKFYEWDSFQVYNLRIYSRGYLPKPLIVSVLDLYEKKTSLKGISEKEIEYMVSKNMINASFGMMVTAIIRDEFEYSDEWFKNAPEKASQLNDYNKSFNRFLFYGWGIWVTAHARHSLFKAIYEFGEDYVYSDTDSIKGLNFDDHEEFFKEYNVEVALKLLKMCMFYNIPFEKVKPKTIKGENKMIGVWERERDYKYFKTCGAKRYIYMYDDNEINLTVSGLNKNYAIPYLKSIYSHPLDIMDMFGEGMYIPAEGTGKMTLTYIDEPIQGTLVDYQGNACEYYEKSCTHMEPQSYYMSLTNDYLKFLKGVQYVEY